MSSEEIEKSMFEERVKNTAREIVACPWKNKKFSISIAHQQDDIFEMIIGKYGLAYSICFGYTRNIYSVYATKKMINEYVQKCCAQYLIDDVLKIVCDYLDLEQTRSIEELTEKIRLALQEIDDKKNIL